MILRKSRKTNAEVPLSPLIDCVFLLLIFFLVTSMLKKTEKQIPVAMPDSQLTVEDRQSARVLTLGIGRDGAVSLGQQGTTEKMLEFEPLPDLPAFLNNLRAERGVDVPIQFAVEAGTETQKVVEVLDACQILGFDDIFVRVRSDDHMVEVAEGM